METERRTGRTTILIAKAIVELLETGECTFQDHVHYVEGAYLDWKFYIDSFKKRFEGFMLAKCWDVYQAKHIGQGKIHISATEKHTQYSKYQALKEKKRLTTEELHPSPQEIKRLRVDQGKSWEEIGNTITTYMPSISYRDLGIKLCLEARDILGETNADGWNE